MHTPVVALAQSAAREHHTNATPMFFSDKIVVDKFLNGLKVFEHLLGVGFFLHFFLEMNY
jgi:hypothetical protein